MSEDGNYWSAFQNITNTGEGENRFYLRHTFTNSDMTLSMRVPFTKGYLNEYLKRLIDLDRDDVNVRHIGNSTDDHPLYAIEIGLAENHKKPVVVLYGGEDGDEYDGIWSAVGATNWLLSTDEGKKLLGLVSVVIIPTVDPDGGIECSYASLADSYYVESVRGSADPEVIYFTKYIRDLVAGGYTITSMVALHNVECTEAPNFFCPIYDLRDSERSKELHQYINKKLPKNYTKSDDYWMISFPQKRFNSWGNALFGSTFAAYEINGRYPNNILNLNELQDLGGYIVSALCEYTAFDVDHNKKLKEKQDKWRISFNEYLASITDENGYVNYYIWPYSLLNNGF